ncbi:threonylcarbamoyl-AMP synthase [Thermaerobacter sp. PB12/4term]|uniref:L-threonylcarbamoyladenylate synthase n=1 Tax=Thermaerobacter sp. PB12/4term TaxID=2293838 RepID=UPI000E3282D1|nr:L-threonylcarbamoyladenylate synthase [Thermaerobacter sp. PB12/4term]QIA26220.1 threonylcarbamoyl-AMP synthase [Thermaerobacter sp. PB12/4term]
MDGLNRPPADPPPAPPGRKTGLPDRAAGPLERSRLSGEGTRAAARPPGAGGREGDPGPGAAWVRLGTDPHQDEAAVQRAGAILRQGGLVAFPTETVYGLGADALNPRAVARIFAAKGRPADNPLIVHVTGPEQAGSALVASWPEVGRRLAERFWPGPLTLVLPAGPAVPAAVRAGLPTVAVRCPAHPVARALIAAAGTPVAAPSANRSGRPSPTRAEDVWADLGPHLDMLLDAGPVPVGVESTVLDVTAWPPRLLRPGGVPAEDLEAVLGVPLAAPPVVAGGEAAPAPGMKYRHYAPEAPLVLAPDAGAGAVFVRRWLAEGQRVALVGCREDLETLLGQLGLGGRWLPLDEDEGDPRRGNGDPTGEAAGFAAGPEDGELAAGVASSPGVGTGPDAATGPGGGVEWDFARGPVVLDLGPRHRPDQQARRLFRALRAADAAGATRVLALAVPERGLGRAVMNRLRKAAAGGEVPGDDHPQGAGRL